MNTGHSRNISYDAGRRISGEQFVAVLQRSTLAARRPVDDAACIDAMLQHADLLCTAWDGDTLDGVARSVTDFAFCCYLSDLAVDRDYQRRGIGRELIRLTQSMLGPKARLILLAAPDAEAYYPRIGFVPHRSAWVLPARGDLR
jgi:GNAT superfamily N-acetyltransferase